MDTFPSISTPEGRDTNSKYWQEYVMKVIEQWRSMRNKENTKEFQVLTMNLIEAMKRAEFEIAILNFIDVATSLELDETKITSVILTAKRAQEKQKGMRIFNVFLNEIGASGLCKPNLGLTDEENQIIAFQASMV
jgi:hypothetical protein